VVFFLVTAAMTAAGAVVPGAVAIVVPIAIGFALQYGINPMPMGRFVVNGATAGGPDEGDTAARFGRGKQEEAQSKGRPTIAGGETATATDHEVPDLDRDKILTLVGIVSLIIVALIFDVDVGFVALTIAAVLSVVSPKAGKGAVNKVAWPTVLLICGIVTYVGLLENIGTIDWLGDQVATISAVLIAALLILCVGGVVSAFASTTGILGALIPLAVPLLETGAVGAAGLIIALSISSSMIDSSPFSTSGALRGQHARGAARLRVPRSRSGGRRWSSSPRRSPG
jgi:di/tricarboxylate transporter